MKGRKVTTENLTETQQHYLRVAELTAELAQLQNRLSEVHEELNGLRRKLGTSVGVDIEVVVDECRKMLETNLQSEVVRYYRSKTGCGRHFCLSLS